VSGPVAVGRIVAAVPRIQIHLCYCSLLDECWLISSDAQDDERRKIPHCERPGADELRPPKFST
jgi:hypothetical protein